MRRSLTSLSRQVAAASSPKRGVPSPLAALSTSSSLTSPSPRPSRRSLATVADAPSSAVTKGLKVETPEAVVVRPGEESLGFEVTANSQGASADPAVPDQEVLGRPIYLDMQATTPLDPRVLDAMLPYLTNAYGNPHSKTHAYGWETETAVEVAREEVAKLLNAGPKDIVWTSGATESNNLAVKGVARFYKGRKKHIITSQTEHKCVLDSCRILQDEGFDVTYLPVEQNGLISLDLLEKSIRPDTCLVSIMMVNNEIGTIQPIKEIGAIVKKHKGVYFHTDAAQAVGKIPIDVEEMNIDLLSISGHKLYGPKGIGALYVRRRPRVRLEPIINGGGQERGLRSGTVPAPLVVGLGEAAKIARREMAFDDEHVRRLSERLHKGITDRCDLIVRNGDVNGYPGCLNLSFSYIEGESMLMAMKDIALSSGSACTSASLEPSYVLRALGAEDDMAHSSIRFGIGRFTTEGEVDFVIGKIVAIVERLRELSPLWEMVQEGIDIKSIDWAQH